MYIFKWLYLLIVLIALGACGGGSGGDGSPASDPAPASDPDQVFGLRGLQSTEEGTVYSTQLTGFDSDGFTYTGSFSVAVREQTMLDGVLVAPVDQLINLSDGETTATITSTSYSDTDGNLILVEVQTTGVSCAPVTPDNIPASGKIGDFGILSPMVCTDDTTIQRNWRVEDAGNDAIHLVGSNTTRDQFDAILTITETTVTLDAAGNILAYSSVLDQLEPFSYTLSIESI